MNDVTPVTVTLNYPVQFGDELVTELKFTRRVRFSDMADASAGTLSMADMARIIGRLTGQDRQVIMRLEGDDIARVMEAATPFLGSGRTTGE